jgi:hypothetical protein
MMGLEASMLVMIWWVHSEQEGGLNDAKYGFDCVDECNDEWERKEGKLVIGWQWSECDFAGAFLWLEELS